MHTATLERIVSTIQSKRVVLFMKGNKAAPQCGFSAQVVSILNQEQIEYCDIDVLSDRASPGIERILELADVSSAVRRRGIPRRRGPRERAESERRVRSRAGRRLSPSAIDRAPLSYSTLGAAAQTSKLN